METGSIKGRIRMLVLGLGPPDPAFGIHKTKTPNKWNDKSPDQIALI